MNLNLNKGQYKGWGSYYGPCVLFENDRCVYYTSARSKIGQPRSLKNTHFTPICTGATKYGNKSHRRRRSLQNWERKVLERVPSQKETSKRTTTFPVPETGKPLNDFYYLYSV